MKQIMIMMLAFSLAVGANAQTKVRGGKAPVRTRVIVATPIYPAWGYGLGYGFGSRFSPFYSPFNNGFNDPFYDPFNRTRVVERVPSELQLQLEEIENEYDFKIDSAKDTYTGKEKRQKVRELKYQKEASLIDARRNFIRKNNNSRVEN